MPEPRLIEVRKNVLKHNDVVARSLRDRFRASGVFVASLVSSPGSGKTAFLEKTLTLLRPDYRVAALVGDLATENDAVRLARSKAPVKQITTGTLCHLEAAMVENALADWNLHELDFLFIENVGNLSAAVEFRWDTAYANIQAVRTGMQVFQLSSKTGAGMNEFLKFLGTRLAEIRQSRQLACASTP